MAVNVYAWPPVAAVGSEWTEIAPVNVSRSLLSGARYVSASERKRRAATLVASSLGKHQMGAGYCEVLKRYLDGGAALVRLNSYPVNWFLDAAGDQSFRQSARREWTAENSPLGWTTGGSSLLWFSGTQAVGTSTTDEGWPALNITGLPANTLVARPGEFLTVFGSSGDTEGETIMITSPATTDGSGAATVRVLTAPVSGGRVNLGTSDTGVFEVTGGLPRAVQTVKGDWTYNWSFLEVFADEVPGGFAELNPWT